MRGTFSDLILALVGAAIAAAATAVWRWWWSRRRHREAIRRHPIAGQYRSHYTDTLHGQTRRVRDRVYVEQDGYLFRGASTNLNSGRSFTFSGRIVNKRFLVGTYGGASRADEASGVIFMKLDSLRDGCIEGIYAGFGAEQADVLAGEWVWRRVSPVSVQRLEEGSPLLSNAVTLMNDALGDGYVDFAELKSFASGEDGNSALFAAVEGESTLVGAASACVLTVSEIQDLCGRLRQHGVARPNLANHVVGQLKASAVVPDRQAEGIGMRLVDARLDFLERAGCSVVVAVSWLGGPLHSSGGLLEAVGFKPLVDIEDYWFDDEVSSSCPTCGACCRCSARVYRLSLHERKRAHLIVGSPEDVELPAYPG